MVSIKNFLLGFLIFLIPLIPILKINNIKQFSSNDFYLFFLILLFVLIILFLLNFLLHHILRKLFNIKIDILFPIICLNYSSIFTYNTIYDFFINYLLIEKNTTYLVVIFIFIITIIISLIIIKFKNIEIIFTRTIYVFVIFNFLFFTYNFFNYYFNYGEENFSRNFNNLEISISVTDIIKNEKLFQSNIYFIILDEMVSLEYANENNIIEYKKIKSLLEKNNLRYIDNSYSNYSLTYLTLQSLIELNYPITEIDMQYKNRRSFFPHMMYQGSISMPLPSIVDLFNDKFIWIGNSWGSCMEMYNQPWECNDRNSIRNLMRISSTIFFHTPIKYILTNWLPNARNWGGQRNLINYVNNIKENNIMNENKFVFVHQMSPHPPYVVTDKCEKQEHEKDNYLGYKSSYNCVLKEIFYFMNYINLNEPNSIVVLQADHGYVLNKDKNDNNSIKERANIFNAIKAPDRCFRKFGEPKSNINTIRFVLNCAYNLDLKKLKDIHYKAFYEGYANYGKVIPYIFN